MNCSYVQHGSHGRETSGVPPRLMLATHHFYCFINWEVGPHWCGTWCSALWKLNLQRERGLASFVRHLANLWEWVKFSYLPWENSAVLRGPRKSFANVSLCGALVVFTGQGNCELLPDPQEHSLVFLQPGLLGAVSELLFFLFSSCLLSSVFKAVCAFIFAQLQDPWGRALSPFLARPKRGYHSLLIPPTFPPVCGGSVELPPSLPFVWAVSSLLTPVWQNGQMREAAALLFKLHSKITGT